MEVVTPAFSKGVRQGEADGEPVVVSCGDVNGGLLDAARDLGNLLLQGGVHVAVDGDAAPGRLGLRLLLLAAGRCRAFLPFGGVEFLLCHRLYKSSGLM